MHRLCRLQRYTISNGNGNGIFPSGQSNAFILTRFPVPVDFDQFKVPFVLGHIFAQSAGKWPANLTNCINMVFRYCDRRNGMDSLIEEMIFDLFTPPERPTASKWLSDPENEDDAIEMLSSCSIFLDFYDSNYGVNPDLRQYPSRDEVLRHIVQENFQAESDEDDDIDDSNVLELVGKPLEYINWCLSNSTEGTFKHYFRLTKTQFLRWEKTIEEFLDRETNLNGEPLITETALIPLRAAIAIHLQVLGGQRQHDVGQIMRVSKSTIQRTFTMMCYAIHLMKSEWVKMPHQDTPQHEVLTVPEVQFLHQTWLLADNTHIKHTARYTENRDDCYNFRKACHTTSVFAACNLNGLFVWTSFMDGRGSDTTSLDQAVLEGGFLDKIPPGRIVLTDAGYPMLSWLIPTYTEGARMYNGEPTQTHMDEFNRRLSSLRTLIEQQFGRMKQKWRMLLRPNDYPADKQPFIIDAATILHNFVIICADPHLAVAEWEPPEESDEQRVDRVQTVQDDYFTERNEPTTVRYAVRHGLLLELIRQMRQEPSSDESD